MIRDAPRCSECDALAQGAVDDRSLPGGGVVVGAHWCRQCAQHCTLARYVDEQAARWILECSGPAGGRLRAASG